MANNGGMAASISASAKRKHVAAALAAARRHHQRRNVCGNIIGISIVRVNINNQLVAIARGAARHVLSASSAAANLGGVAKWRISWQQAAARCQLRSVASSATSWHSKSGEIAKGGE